jgi:hypothetical protein
VFKPVKENSTEEEGKVDIGDEEVGNIPVALGEDSPAVEKKNLLRAFSTLSFTVQGRRGYSRRSTRRWSRLRGVAGIDSSSWKQCELMSCKRRSKTHMNLVLSIP